jgi:hypothetical protein
LRNAIVDSRLPLRGDVDPVTSDLVALDALRDRAEAAAQAFLHLLDRLGVSTSQSASRLPQAEHQRVGGLLRRSLERAIQSFELVRKKLTSITEHPAPATDYSSIEVTLAAAVAGAIPAGSKCWRAISHRADLTCAIIAIVYRGNLLSSRAFASP